MSDERMTDTVTGAAVPPCDYCGHDKFADCHQTGARRERSPCVCKGYVPGVLRTLQEEIVDGLAMLAAVIPLTHRETAGADRMSIAGRIEISYCELLKIPAELDRVISAIEVASALGHRVEVDVVYQSGPVALQFYALPRLEAA